MTVAAPRATARATPAGFDEDDLYELAAGGTAVGTGLNTHPEFGTRVASAIAEQLPIDLARPVGPAPATLRGPDRVRPETVAA